MNPGNQALETFSPSGEPLCQKRCADTDFFGTAVELLKALKAEEQILRKFSGAELLALLPKKEYLVNELGWKLKAARNASENSFEASESLKAILAEICRLNTANGIFIEKSLSYWGDLQAILSPPGYGPNGRKGACTVRAPNGITFQRKV